MRRYIRHFFSREFLRYVMVVSTGAAIDFFLFVLLHYKFHMAYWLAAAYAFGVAATLGFLALKYFAFKSFGRLPGQAAKHGATILNTLFLTELFLWIGVDLLLWPAWLVKIFTYACTLTLNFTLGKFAVFK